MSLSLLSVHDVHMRITSSAMYQNSSSLKIPSWVLNRVWYFNWENLEMVFQLQQVHLNCSAFAGAIIENHHTLTSWMTELQRILKSSTVLDCKLIKSDRGVFGEKRTNYLLWIISKVYFPFEISLKFLFTLVTPCSALPFPCVDK